MPARGILLLHETSSALTLEPLATLIAASSVFALITRPLGVRQP